jgi:hypothetical protein
MRHVCLKAGVEYKEEDEPKNRDKEHTVQDTAAFVNTINSAFRQYG